MNNMEFLYELKPQFDNAKSFYKKANVYRDDKGKILLMSYSTIVAEIIDKAISDTNKTQLNIFGWYSMTTARHINEFIQQYGFDKMNKKQMEEVNTIWKSI